MLWSRDDGGGPLGSADGVREHAARVGRALRDGRQHRGQENARADAERRRPTHERARSRPASNGESDVVSHNREGGTAQ